MHVLSYRAEYPPVNTVRKYCLNSRQDSMDVGLPPDLTLVSCSVYFSTLKMEAICSSETSVDTQRVRRSRLALSIRPNKAGVFLRTETESSLRNVVLIKNWTLDNVQKVNYWTTRRYIPEDGNLQDSVDVLGELFSTGCLFILCILLCAIQYVEYHHQHNK
jgi:hypothetical protein